MKVAALFVCRTGPYWDRDDVDAWDVERDARLYEGPYPVVAHPPCAAWCQLAGLREARYGYPKGEDDGVFASALASVRKWGGVLEHPAFTKAWPEYGLPKPPRVGWGLCLDGGWVCELSQAAYGHRARKLTWLYYYGCRDPLPIDWSRPEAEAWVSGGDSDTEEGKGKARVWQSEAKRTPVAFADVLIELARHSREQQRSKEGES